MFKTSEPALSLKIVISTLRTIETVGSVFAFRFFGLGLDETLASTSRNQFHRGFEVVRTDVPLRSSKNSSLNSLSHVPSESLVRA